jgi:hypothetical protein
MARAAGIYKRLGEGWVTQEKIRILRYDNHALPVRHHRYLTQCMGEVFSAYGSLEGGVGRGSGECPIAAP